MKQKLLILTSDKSVFEWNTLHQKLHTLQTAINNGKGANFTVTIKHLDERPVLNSRQRISHNWLAHIFTPFFNERYDIIGYHMTMGDWLRAGVTPTLRGANPRTQDKNYFGDFYWRADEHTLRQGLNQFEQTGGHELMHEYFQHTGLPDKTHDWHEANPDILPRLANLDWTLFQPERFRLKYKKTFLTELLLLWERTAYISQRINNPTSLQPRVQRLADQMVAEMARRGTPIRIVEGYRSPERQDELYAQGRTTPGRIVTNARGGQSFHNWGVAVDFVFRREGYNASEAQWEELGKLGESLGFEWGGRWSSFIDKPHFELTLGYTLSDFQNQRVDWYNYM